MVENGAREGRNGSRTKFRGVVGWTQHGQIPDYSAHVMSFLLPGQPIPIPRGPALQLGSGTYSRDNEVRSSILGVPQFEGSVCIFLSSLCTAQGLYLIEQSMALSTDIVDTLSTASPAPSSVSQFRCTRDSHATVATAGNDFDKCR